MPFEFYVHNMYMNLQKKSMKHNTLMLLISDLFVECDKEHFCFSLLRMMGLLMLNRDDFYG